MAAAASASSIKWAPPPTGDRERFTMDEGCSDAVLEVFTRLYEKGYIYKGSRIINWCPVCKTSISDAEVNHEEQDGFFWHINYPIVGEEGRFCGDRHHPSGDHAGRYGCGCEPGG